MADIPDGFKVRVICVYCDKQKDVSTFELPHGWHTVTNHDGKERWIVCSEKCLIDLMQGRLAWWKASNEEQYWQASLVEREKIKGRCLIEIHQASVASVTDYLARLPSEQPPTKA